MSLRIRLNVIYTAVLILVFVLFGIVVYTLTSAILLEAIDQDLRVLAEQVVSQAEAVNRGTVTELRFPERSRVTACNDVTAFFTYFVKQLEVLLNFHSLID